MHRAVIGWLMLGTCLASSAWAQTPNASKKASNRLQQTQTNSDSLRTALQKSTGLSLETSGLNPTASAMLPGGKSTATSLSSLLGETLPELGLKAKSYKEQKTERRRKAQKAKLAKVQYADISMQKMTVKYGSGDRATIEDFHVLKEYQPIDERVRSTQTRWYDPKSRKLNSSVIKDKSRALPLHGPYKRYVGGHLIEEGYYYLGTKDGRWVRYDANYNLLDKAHWRQGFPAESRISYYDSAHTKIKEVIPIQFGVVEGEYLQFYDGGQLMTYGKYERGEKVGRWVEYYQYRRQHKKEIQYPKTAWDEEFEPFILREWDDKGKLLYDSSKDPRATAEEDEGN